MKKNKEADQIISNYQNLLLEMLYDLKGEELWDIRSWIYFIEEEGVYEIKKLALPANTEIFYLEKLHNVFGNFSEYLYD